MQVRRLDKDTVSLEEGGLDGVSVILYYPTSMSDADVIEACKQSAERLEKKAQLYRALIQTLE